MKKIGSVLSDYWVPILLLVIGVGIGLCFIHPILKWYDLLTDREAIKGYITAWGAAAPGVLILLQVLQVIFSPVPGEVTGFIGGYLFGPLAGFVYSTIGLTLGSVINFGIGRLLGQRIVRRLIPPAHLEKLDRFLKHQGIIVVLVFFIFPGFPKDYLCLFLGITAMPFNVFFILVTLGRMPGTLVLSIQGAFLFQKMYGLLLTVFGISIIFVLLVVLFRERIYEWVQRYDRKP